MPSDTWDQGGQEEPDEGETGQAFGYKITAFTLFWVPIVIILYSVSVFLHEHLGHVDCNSELKTPPKLNILKPLPCVYMLIHTVIQRQVKKRAHRFCICGRYRCFIRRFTVGTQDKVINNIQHLTRYAQQYSQQRQVA